MLAIINRMDLIRFDRVKIPISLLRVLFCYITRLLKKTPVVIYDGKIYFFYTLFITDLSLVSGNDTRMVRLT